MVALGLQARWMPRTRPCLALGCPPCLICSVLLWAECLVWERWGEGEEPGGAHPSRGPGWYSARTLAGDPRACLGLGLRRGSWWGRRAEDMQGFPGQLGGREPDAPLLRRREKWPLRKEERGRGEPGGPADCLPGSPVWLGFGFK